MKQIVLFPIGTLSEEERQSLLDNDYLPISVPDPSKVVLPVPVADLGRDRLLLVALEAMGNDALQGTLMAKARFVDGLVTILREREKERKEAEKKVV